MDNLTKANEEIKIAEDISRGHDLTVELALQSAQAYAAIAQAEAAARQAAAMERIADALEHFVSSGAYSIDLPAR
jgi:hypothetical protein